MPVASGADQTRLYGSTNQKEESQITSYFSDTTLAAVAAAIGRKFARADALGPGLGLPYHLGRIILDVALRNHLGRQHQRGCIIDRGSVQARLVRCNRSYRDGAPQATVAAQLIQGLLRFHRRGEEVSLSESAPHLQQGLRSRLRFNNLRDPAQPQTRRHL